MPFQKNVRAKVDIACQTQAYAIKSIIYLILKFCLSNTIDSNLNLLICVSVQVTAVWIIRSTFQVIWAFKENFRTNKDTLKQQQLLSKIMVYWGYFSVIPSVALHIETSHLICTANHTGLKWVKLISAYGTKCLKMDQVKFVEDSF